VDVITHYMFMEAIADLEAAIARQEAELDVITRSSVDRPVLTG
jgi:hypothetical protein